MELSDKLIKKLTTITSTRVDIAGDIWLSTAFSMFKIRIGRGLFEAVYHESRQGKPIKPSRVQIPRWKLVALLDDYPILRVGDRVPKIKDDGTF